MVVWLNFVQICLNFIQILSGNRSEFSEIRPIRWAPNFFSKKNPKTLGGGEQEEEGASARVPGTKVEEDNRCTAGTP